MSKLSVMVYQGISQPIRAFKVDFVEKDRMIVWRQHDQMHPVRPDPIFVGWDNDLGWEKYRDADNRHMYPVPPTTIDAVAPHLAIGLKTRSLRLVGDPQLKVTRVGMGGHEIASNIQLFAKSELIVVFEARERETAEYARDCGIIRSEERLAAYSA